SVSTRSRSSRSAPSASPPLERMRSPSRLISPFDSRGTPEAEPRLWTKWIIPESTSRTIRLVEIAELLGVTKQRAHQLADAEGFPAPVAEDARGRVWSRYGMQAWAARC